MKNIKNANWIKSPQPAECAVFDFCKDFEAVKAVERAVLEITAFGIYEAKINGERVGDFIFAPGWTSYRHRLQVQTYDVTLMIKEKNNITVGVAPGWKAHRTFCEEKRTAPYLGIRETGLLCALTVDYSDGTQDIICTDGTWSVKQSSIRYSDLYNGCVFDPSYEAEKTYDASTFYHTFENLIDQQGEKIVENERIAAKEIIITPKGETIIDFGQNLTGYVEFKIKGKKGERAVIYHAEVLDADGNFYRDNLRSAKAESVFVCDGEEHIYKPSFNFFGFRYIKLEGFSDEIKKENFTAVVVHSQIKRTGYFECSDERVNKLFSNVIWGQKGNFVDVPTDCPQRDERLGWTGDAEVFIKTASYNFDVERFFLKWLADLRTDQRDWGAIPHVIPDTFNPDAHCSAAWADAATVCPWQIYQTYGNKELLKISLDSMREYLDYILRHTRDGLWNIGWHFGDWLNLDASSAEDCSKGTEKSLIATAYFILSSEIYIKSCELWGVDCEEYKAFREKSIAAFRKEYMENGRIKPEYATQTACVLATHFRISDNLAETAKQLNELVTECGHLKTGFVGTPYLLHALADNGYGETAYSLVLREEYPSWLFSVKMGATTIWEHWDSVREDGTMWSTSMNSFNHYAYGSVADWLYEKAAGIRIDEKKPAFEHIIFAPVTDERLDFVKASIESRNGAVKASWKRENGRISYEFTVPAGSTATVVLNGKSTDIGEGTYTF